MDKRERYRLIVSRLIEEYASYKPSHGQIETEAIVDRVKDHYEVMHVGWDGSRRIHGSVVHIDIIDDKVWIQYDGTSRRSRTSLSPKAFRGKTSSWDSTRPRCANTPNLPLIERLHGVPPEQRFAHAGLGLVRFLVPVAEPGMVQAEVTAPGRQDRGWVAILDQ